MNVCPCMLEINYYRGKRMNQVTRAHVARFFFISRILHTRRNIWNISVRTWKRDKQQKKMWSNCTDMFNGSASIVLIFLSRLYTFFDDFIIQARNEAQKWYVYRNSDFMLGAFPFLVTNLIHVKNVVPGY